MPHTLHLRKRLEALQAARAKRFASIDNVETQAIETPAEKVKPAETVEAGTGNGADPPEVAPAPRLDDPYEVPDIPEADVPEADVPEADVPEADVPQADGPEAERGDDAARSKPGDDEVLADGDEVEFDAMQFQVGRCFHLMVQLSLARTSSRGLSNMTKAGGLP